MTQILLIEDDPLIIAPLERALTGIGYNVCVAQDGETGLALGLHIRPDIVVLDVMLPQLDGWDVCKRLRACSTVPILMLTALGEEVDRILGLELGADDYLTKPFSTRELIARIRTLLRRVELDTDIVTRTRRITVRDIELDLDKRQVKKGDQVLALRYKEFELLSLLMAHAGEVVTRADIFDKVWGTDWLGDMRTLDVHMSWLREKMESDASHPEYIQTVRGVGYRFTAS